MKELDTHYESFNETNPEKIKKFEKAWLENQPLEIAECLPSVGDPTYKGTLEELAHIDREFRWKNYYQSSPEKLKKLESYWELYPTLVEFKLGLIQGEFQLANRFLPDVSVDQFVERFGETINGQQLRQVLNQRLQQWKLLQPVRPGSSLGRYEIVNEHGRGGFGAVWRAKDTKLGRRIAVKQLGQRLTLDAESRRRFISEARVTARLEHPGIVPVYDISQVEEDHAYYTMRLIRGSTMGEAITELFEFEVTSDEFRRGSNVQCGVTQEEHSILPRVGDGLKLWPPFNGQA